MAYAGMMASVEERRLTASTTPPRALHPQRLDAAWSCRCQLKRSSAQGQVFENKECGSSSEETLAVINDFLKFSVSQSHQSHTPHPLSTSRRQP